MIDGKLHEFAGNVINRRRIIFGDVRRIQRDYLPTGITSREEVVLLIWVSAKLDRADKAWAEWLVPAVRHFVATSQRSEHPTEDAAKWVERLVAGCAYVSKAGRRIAGQLRRELAQLRTVQSTSTDQPPPVWNLAASMIDLPAVSQPVPAQDSAA